ncbi:MAG: hypothetical protein SVQ76_01780 [Candidatus Nanohaloarchaea archaeon]|nr:hypothetical protein [Candidatus Nanohaloarchaea archaeon]
MEEEDLPSPEQAEGDQLFIKVPEYKNVLKDLEGVRQIIANMRESVQVLNEVQKVKEKSVDVFIENVERLNRELDDIDESIPEVHDIEIHMGEGETQRVEEAEDEVIDESVKELRGELEDLRDELGKLD